MVCAHDQKFLELPKVWCCERQVMVEGEGLLGAVPLSWYAWYACRHGWELQEPHRSLMGSSWLIGPPGFVSLQG